MNRLTHSVTQGSADWLSLRAKHFTASELSAAAGKSKYQSRQALIKAKATGIVEEVGASTQRLFDAGHAAEAAARPIVEAMLGEDLFPVTMSCEIDGLPLLASLDGITMLGDIIWENKLLNESLKSSVQQGKLDDHYALQVEQQLMVSGATKCYFTTSDGTEAGTFGMWYESNPDIRAQIVPIWKQFAEDVKNHIHVEAKAAPVAEAIEDLPALTVQLVGQVTSSNLATFQTVVMERIKAINTTLVTDNDFATADKMVKFLDDGEKRLELVKSQALAQTASIDELFRTIDAISAEARAKRLELDKLVKVRKESLKAELVAAAAAAVKAHYDAINATLGQYRISPPQSLQMDLGAAIKGKKTISSMRDALDAAAAAAKIDASQTAERIRANVKLIDAHADHAGLMPDAVSLAHSKTPEDLENLVAARIAEHEKQEAERVARIEREALEKARREVEAKAHAESIKKAAELQKSEQKQTADEVIDAIVTYDLITLDDVNERLSPILITDTAFARLGYNSSISEAQFQNLCAKLHNIITVAQTQKGVA